MLNGSCQVASFVELGDMNGRHCPVCDWPRLISHQALGYEPCTPTPFTALPVSLHPSLATNLLDPEKEKK